MVETYLSRRYDLPPFTFEEFMPLIRTGPVRRIPRMCFVHPHCRDIGGSDTDRFMRRLRRKKVVVLVRDPKQVVFTYYFRLRKRFNDPLALSLSLQEFIRHPELGIDRVVDFTNTWYRADGHFRDFLFLRFEDIQADPVGELSRLIAFLGLDVDQDLLTGVIAETRDVTTQAIEDTSVGFSAEDHAYLAAAVRKLDRSLGY